MNQCGYCMALTYPKMLDGRLECPHCGAPWLAGQIGKEIGEAIAEELVKDEDRQLFALPPEDYTDDPETEQRQLIAEKIAEDFAEETKKKPIELDRDDRPLSKTETAKLFFTPRIVLALLTILMLTIVFLPPPYDGPNEIRVVVIADEPVFESFMMSWVKYDGQIGVGNDTVWESSYCYDGVFESTMHWSIGTNIYVILTELEWADAVMLGPFVVEPNFNTGNEHVFTLEVRPEPPESFLPASVFSTKLINKSHVNSLRGESVSQYLLTGAVKGVKEELYDLSRLITFKSDIDFQAPPPISTSPTPSVHPTRVILDSTRNPNGVTPPLLTTQDCLCRALPKQSNISQSNLLWAREIVTCPQTTTPFGLDMR